MTPDFSAFEKSAGVDFKNKKLLAEAFTHRSYLNENPSPELRHNERLEFLGDAVLELAVTEVLFKKFPASAEGDLAPLRAALVNAVMLSEIAGGLDFNSYLLLSRGEAKDLGRARQFILANAFEALVGALYLDRGYGAAKVLIKKLFRDAKSLFQERAQEQAGVTPTYEVLKEWGPDHDKHFVVGAYLGKELAGEGEGPSKQEAQQNAAERALKLRGWD